MTEEAHLTQLRNYRGIVMLAKQLTEIETIADEQTEISPRFKVGDIITYRLTTSEREKHVHVSTEAKYCATKSFPQRVTRVTENNLFVKPLWTTGKERSVPKIQCKLITTFIPELMREELQQLYPSLRWIESQQQGATGTTGQVPYMRRRAEHTTTESEVEEEPRRKRRQETIT
jgi:hypothetical protein